MSSALERKAVVRPAPVLPPAPDPVETWGVDSFPASDPPANW